MPNHTFIHWSFVCYDNYGQFTLCLLCLYIRSNQTNREKKNLANSFTGQCLVDTENEWVAWQWSACTWSVVLRHRFKAFIVLCLSHKHINTVRKTLCECLMILECEFHRALALESDDFIVAIRNWLFDAKNPFRRRC